MRAVEFDEGIAKHALSPGSAEGLVGESVGLVAGASRRRSWCGRCAWLCRRRHGQVPSFPARRRVPCRAVVSMRRKAPGAAPRRRRSALRGIVQILGDDRTDHLAASESAQSRKTLRPRRCARITANARPLPGASIRALAVGPEGGAIERRDGVKIGFAGAASTPSGAP